MTTFADLGIVANPAGRTEQRVACPQCAKSERDDALGVNVERGVFHCFRCGWSGRVGGEHGAPLSPVRRIDDPAIAERKRERLRATWKGTVSLSHPSACPVRNYLAARGLRTVLESPPKVLRAHPALSYWDGTRELGKFPAMVALFADPTGKAITLHATYLRADGSVKAPVPSPKKILGVMTKGATRGGSIRLFEPRDGVLGIAEGIETALSLHLIQKLPTWASFCADNLERIRLPERLRELHIGIDLDESGKGEEVARSLAKRVHKWSSRTKIYYVRPELPGFGDLNDELRRRVR
jgi:putative DNA primase/helicase